jgi:predicted  nucleic acid-binding Zn-ribbon protein
MSEESHTVKQAFLMFGDAMRSLNSTQQHTNTLLGSVIDELKSLHRGHQEIVQRMDAAAERSKDIERRVSEGERKSDGKIKVLERRLDIHDQQLATLRESALKA